MDKTTKKWVTGIVVLILVVIGWSLLADRMGINTSVDAPSLTTEQENITNTNTSSSSTVNSSRYQTYSPSKVTNASGKVVLFFRAAWHPNSSTLDANIRTNASSIPSGVLILEVDFDTATTLKQKYAVNTPDTLVQIDKSGNQIFKWNGNTTLTEVLSTIR